MSHAFTPSLRHDDYCVHCGSPRGAAVHDTFSSSTEHPGLSKLSITQRLASLLGCTVEELRCELQEMVAGGDRLRGFVDARGVKGWCTRSIDDDNRCERLDGHRGLHTHLHDAWDHGTDGRPRLRWSRCTAVAKSVSAVELRTARCVLMLGHHGDAHELDSGEVFR
jgi:hypothetical protein